MNSRGYRRSRVYIAALIALNIVLIFALVVTPISSGYWPITCFVTFVLLGLSWFTLVDRGDWGCLFWMFYVPAALIGAPLCLLGASDVWQMLLWPVIVGLMLVLLLPSRTFRPAETGRRFRPGDYRVFGIPAQGLHEAQYDFGASAVEAGRTGENLTANILERIAQHVPDAVVLHSLRIREGVDADVDHAIVKGRTILLIDSKYYAPGRYSLVNDVDERGHSIYIHGATNDTMGRSAMPWAVSQWRGQFPGSRIHSYIVIHSKDPNNQIEIGQATSGPITLLPGYAAEQQIASALLSDRRTTRTGLIDFLRGLVKGRQSPRHPGDPVLGNSRPRSSPDLYDVGWNYESDEYDW